MDETTGVESLAAEHEPRSPGAAGQNLRKLAALAQLDPGLAALVVMAVIGFGVAIYLTIVHYDARIPLVCPTTGIINCELVTSSQWSVIPGTTWPITFPGMLWFAVSAGLAIKLLSAVARGEPESRGIRQVQLIWSGLGMLTVLYLVYAEIVRLHAICEWCTVVHLLTFASFLIVIDRYFRVPLVAASPAVRAPKPNRPTGKTASSSPRLASAAARASSARAASSAATRQAGTARPSSVRSNGMRSNGTRPMSAARRPAQKARGKR